MSLVSAMLKDSLDVIRDRSKWCRFWSARDKNDNITDPCGPDAAKWCAVGIIARTCGPNWVLEIECLQALRAAAKELWGQSFIIGVNDSEMLGHDAVVMTFERAIAELEKSNGTVRCPSPAVFMCAA